MVSKKFTAKKISSNSTADARTESEPSLQLEGEDNIEACTKGEMIYSKEYAECGELFLSLRTSLWVRSGRFWIELAILSQGETKLKAPRKLLLTMVEDLPTLSLFPLVKMDLLFAPRSKRHMKTPHRHSVVFALCETTCHCRFASLRCQEDIRLLD